MSSTLTLTASNDKTESPDIAEASTTTSREIAQNTATVRPRRSQPRRRHSSYLPEQWSVETEDIQVLVNCFLSSLGKRLEFLERYGQPNLVDSSIDCAYSTLHAVHDSCMHVSDAGWKRASVLVQTIDETYRDALIRKENLDQKVREGVKLMEGLLSDFETKAFESIRHADLTATASDLYDSGKRTLDHGVHKAAEIVDEGIERARRAKHELATKIDEAILMAKERGLIVYDELPYPWRNNPHILKGYRFCETRLDCVRSCFAFNNETVNIWSHFIGLILVLAIAFYFYPTSINFALSSKADVFIAAVFFFAACKCLVCSTVWHCMNSISCQSLMERFACVDYTGISFLVAASIMTTEYTAFYCEPVSRWTYMALTVIFGVGGVILPWHPTFNRPDMAWARVGFYVSLAATGLLPVAQLILTRGPMWAIYFYAPITKSLAVYVLGALLYAAKFPERFWPGVFDYVGGSHNIWHLAVLGGILFHYTAMQRFFADAFARSGGPDARCVGVSW